MQAITRWLRRQSSWIESQQVSILSAATILLFANVASAVAGLVRNYVLSAIYASGTYGNLDTYFVAFRLPEFLYQVIVAGSLSAAFVPMFAQKLQKNRDEAFAFAQQTMHLLLLIFLLLSVAIVIWTEPFVVRMTGHDFASNPENVRLAVKLTRIMALSQLFFAVSGFFTAMLQSAKRFILPALGALFYNIGIMLVTLIAHSWLGLEAAAWGTVAGAFFHMAIQIPLVWKIGYRWQWHTPWNSGALRTFLLLTAPRTLAIALTQVNIWIVTFLATGLGTLALTVVTFAQQLMGFPIRFFGVPISQAALPFLSAESTDIIGFRRTVFRSLRQILFFAVPASVFLLVLRVPLVRLAFGAPGFSWQNTLATAEALGILAVSVGPQSATHLLMRAFYALNDTVTPLIASLLYVFTTAGLGWYFTMNMGLGIRGIAIALSLAGSLEAAFLLIALLWRIGWQEVGSVFGSLLRISAAGFLMAITLFVFQRVLDLYVFETTRTFALIQLTLIVTAMGSGVYIAICWLLKIEELLILRQILRRLRGVWKKIPPTLFGATETTS